MKKNLFLITYFLVLCCLTSAQMRAALDKAGQIKILESDRTDVRRIFADFKSKIKSDDFDDSSSDIFYAGDAEIYVDYSKGECEDDDSEGFRVPKWKVQFIRIEVETPVKPEDAGIDLSKYKKERTYRDSRNDYTYYDKNAGIIFSVRKGEIYEINLIPPVKYYGLLCDRERAQKLVSTSSIFERKLKERILVIDRNASVEKITLNRTTISAECQPAQLKDGKTCSKSKQKIKVFVKGVDSENDNLTYDYTVSAGKIIGAGTAVVWDLTGVKPGIYTITAAVDDGCGFCGGTKTKTITVKKCRNCR